MSRTSWYYKKKPKDDGAIRMRMREIAETRIRYGFWRIFVLLRREGWADNHKRVYRIYKEEGLNLRRKRPRRRKAAAHRMERPNKRFESMDILEKAHCGDTLRAALQIILIN